MEWYRSNGGDAVQSVEEFSITPEKIHLGYEVKTGKAVSIAPVHLAATGITREAGKTTALEALAFRSGKTCLVFRTKLGEGENGFAKAHQVPMFFKSRSDWQYVESLLEAATREDQKFNRAYIRWICENTHGDLQEVWNNVKRQLKKVKQGSWQWSIYYNLDAYFELVVPQLSRFHFSDRLALHKGQVNLMDLEVVGEQLSRDTAAALQALVIRATLDEIFERWPDTTVILPEAATFIQTGKAVTPVNAAAEAIARQGATRHITLWLDSQDVVGIIPAIRGQISTWLLGKQSGGNQNEVKRSLDLLTLPKDKMVTPDEVQTLPLGQFYVVTGKEVLKVYAQPIWLDDETAIRAAEGKVDVATISQPMSVREIVKGRGVNPEVVSALNKSFLARMYPGELSVVPAPDPEIPSPRTEDPVERMAYENAEGKLQGQTSMERMANLVVFQEKKIDELRNEIEGFSSYMGKEARARDEQLRGLQAQIDNMRAHQIPAVGSNPSITDEEIVYDLKHTEHTEDLYTKTGGGRVMYALVVDRLGEPSTLKELEDTMKEHGWSDTSENIRLTCISLNKRGLIVSDERIEGKARTYRPPKKVRINLVNDKV